MLLYLKLVSVNKAMEDIENTRLPSHAHGANFGEAETQFFSKHPDGIIVGLDEAARGTLAGSMYGAAVALDKGGFERIRDFVYDSKVTRTPALRKRMAESIQSNSVSIYVSRITVDEINAGDNLDFLNRKVLQDALDGTLAGMPSRKCAPTLVLCDSTRLRPVYNGNPVDVYIKGERLHASIAAASLLAKSAFDDEVAELHKLYPRYNFLAHSGYGTASHLGKIRTLGYLPVHRVVFKSFNGMFPAKI